MLIDRVLAALESQFAFLKRLDFQAEMGKRAAEFGDTYVQARSARRSSYRAASLPTLLLAPFFAFFFLRDGTAVHQARHARRPQRLLRAHVYMFERVDATAKSYFQGLLKLTADRHARARRGVHCGRRAERDRDRADRRLSSGSRSSARSIGCVLAILVAATAHQNDLWVVYGVVGVFVVNRVLDNFFFIPLTVGRSIRMHPLPTVLMVFIGGAVAGIPGLILALPLAGVVGTIVGTIAGIVRDPRLRARNAQARALLQKRVTADLPI